MSPNSTEKNYLKDKKNKCNNDLAILNEKCFMFKREIVVFVSCETLLKINCIVGPY